MRGTGSTPDPPTGRTPHGLHAPFQRLHRRPGGHRRRLRDHCRLRHCHLRPRRAGSPELTLEDGIWLNGSEALGEDYETFHLPGTNGPDGTALDSFCKTGRRPYDTVVAAIHISAAIRNGQRFETDGTWEDWAAAVELFGKAVRPFTGDKLLMLEMIVLDLRHVPSEAPAGTAK